MPEKIDIKQISRFRSIEFDFVRCLAIIFVIAGHFFSLNTEYRTTVFNGELSMVLQGMAKMLFGAGVPLFIILTGMLNTHKIEYSWKYIWGMKKVLLAYLLFSIITILFRKYYLLEGESWGQWIMKILNFSAIPYSWYIEMWIGLYLLTPLLNKCYDAFDGKSLQIRWMLGILFAITAIPIFTNRYNMELLPDFWVSCYPVLFFMVGRYIKDGGFGTIKNRWMVVFIVLVCLINPIVSYVGIKGHAMLNVAGDHNALLGAPMSIAVFLLIYRCKGVESWNKVVKWIITRISILSLDIYLCCFIADRLVYPFFMDRYFDNQSDFGWFFFIIIPCVVVISMVIAEVKQLLFKAVRL